MMEFIKIFLISFISDLDNIVIYVTILKRYSSSLVFLLILPVILAVNRTFYVTIVHTVYELPGVELFIGVVLLVIALKMATQQIDVPTRGLPSALKTMFYIIVIDFLLCIDGVLIVSQVSDSVLLIFFGFGISLFILLLFSRVVLKILNYFPMFYVIAASFIGYVAMDNITNDQIVYTWILSFHDIFPSINVIPMLSKVTAILIICLGLLMSVKVKKIKKVR